MSPLSLVLAVIAAVCNALSSVLQRRANRDQEGDDFNGHFLLQLVRRRAWLGGFAALVGSFVLQATALRFGSLAAVEPVLAVELPLTLLLAGWLLRSPLARRDVGAAVVMAAGLAAFLVAVGPSDAPPSAASGAEVLAAACTAAGVAALVLAARFGPARASAALYGAAAGSAFGLAAAMMKIAVSALGRGSTFSVFGRWELYGMAAAGVAALVLVQAALRAGTLVAVQPGLTLLDPLVSVFWGTVVLGESANTGSILLVAVAGAAAMVTSAVVLSRSPAIGGSD